MSTAKITAIHFSRGPTRKEPKVGDRRVTKKHGLQVRVQCMGRDWVNGKPIGRLVSNGRPMFDWRKPSELDPWDRHLLTPEERAAFFPPERGAA